MRQPRQIIIKGYIFMRKNPSVKCGVVNYGISKCQIVKKTLPDHFCVKNTLKMSTHMPML